ncbi:MAG: Uncharacterized protein CEN90_47 [Parcubacteria group bacterium Licking1014_17]|nr:MAG: Uncharacterized protein CEN90_47 [Parcubacteria group bacterium Licking1014_17]
MRTYTKKFQDRLRLEKRRRSVVKPIIYTLVVLAVLAAGIFVLFFSDLFYVKEINISGAEKIQGLNVAQFVNSWLDSGFIGIKRRSNSIIFGQDMLARSLMNQSARISSVVIKRESPHKLDITVTERSPAGIWCYETSGSCYYFDTNGYAYSKIGATSGHVFLKVNDEVKQDTEIGRPVSDNSLFQLVKKVSDSLAQAKFAITEFVIPKDNLNELDFRTNLGFLVKIDTTEDIDRQISALNLLLSEKPYLLKHLLEYIDLRIPSRIYYK